MNENYIHLYYWAYLLGNPDPDLLIAKMQIIKRKQGTRMFKALKSGERREGICRSIERHTKLLLLKEIPCLDWL